MYVSIHEQPMMAYGEYRTHKFLLIYIPPILLILGTVGNVLSFCVLVRRSLRQTSAYNLLAALSLADTLVLYVGLLRRWIGELTGRDMRDFSNWSCRMINVIGYSASIYATWLLIAITVERFVVTVHGLRALTMCSTSRAVKTTLLILGVVVTINCHFLLTTELRVYEMDDGYGVLSCSSAVGYEYLVEHIWPWIDATLYCFLPFVIICVLNAMIVNEVIRARRRRQQFLEQHIISSSTPPSVLSEGSVRLTVMLLSVTCTFLFCTLPMMVTMIYRATSGPAYDDPDEISKFTLARTVSELLMYTNHSVNFYLYLLTGHRFRKELRTMLWQCCRCGRKKSSSNNNNRTLVGFCNVRDKSPTGSPEMVPLNGIEAKEAK